MSGESDHWSCITCGEIHSESFEACWNCGTNDNGKADLEFKVTEPMNSPAAAVESELPFAGLPEVKLPQFCYVALIPAMWGQLCVAAYTDTFPPDESLDALSNPIVILSLIFVLVCVYIPIVFVIGHAVLRAYWRGQKLHSDLIPGMVWFVSIFKLPNNGSVSNRLFRWMYYGSLLGPPAVGVGIGIVQYLSGR